ncbi:TonB-dependent receptor [candidate division KSB3 bacterium]|uniref:TonB-dependent receptor n=1 Tax=candidate division KSB3 bacterium TaxID=2044937 RepID=A0A9D5Q843_9BACT|nr:TonB-dependent receptor [candidate division KSB3 bacterium]MBD3327554.1 TonB-dependent receptor [candidate division KSB3 bacterium]
MSRGVIPLIVWSLFAACLVCLRVSPAVAQPVASTAEAAPPPSQDTPLEPSELSLFEPIPVVVTASKRPERIAEAPSIISVITREDIKRMGARTIMDVLRTIPGIDIVKDASNLSQIAVRGLRSEASAGVKILVDGHPLNDPITGGATTFYDALPLKNVQRIEIIRGPASAIYGSNAFVSVINIITLRAQEIDGLEIFLGAGSASAVNPAFLLGNVFNELEVTVYADYYTTDGNELFVKTDALTVYDETPRAEETASVSRAPGTFQESQETIDLSYTLRYRDLTLRGKFFDKHRGPFLTDFYALNTQSREDTRHIYTGLEYHRFLTERFELSSEIYVEYFHLDTHEHVAPGITLFPSDTGPGVVYPHGLISNFRAESWRVGSEHQVNFRLFPNNDLTLGVAYEYFTLQEASLHTNVFNLSAGFPPDVLVDIQTIFPEVDTASYQNFAAIFAQDTWQIRPNFDLTLGVRGDYFSDFGGIFTPKVGMTYEPHDALNLKFLFGSAFRIPSFAESFLDVTSPDTLPQDDLVVEELRTFEVGLSTKPADWFIGEINYFYTDINELTEVAEGRDTGSYPIGTTRTYQNIGGIDIQGVEVEVRGKSERELGLGIIPRIIGSWFRLNYSYQETTDSVSYEQVPNMPRHKGNVGVGFHLSSEERPDDRFNAFRIFRTFSDEFSLYFNLFLCGERDRSDADIRDPLPGFAVLDMTLTAYDLFEKGLDVSLKVNNLFDEAYRDPSPEFTAVQDYTTIPDDFPNPGRSLFFEIRYTF